MATTLEQPERSALRAVLAVLLGLLVIPLDSTILSVMDWPAALTSTRFGWPFVVNLFDLVALIVLIRVVGGVGLLRQGGIVGLWRPVKAAALWGAILFVPALVLLALVGRVDANVTSGDILFKGVVFPFIEEAVFRGLAMGVLLSVAGWRFVYAALVPSIFFGLVHATQGADVVDTLSLMAITGIGGLVFGWLYVRWDRNLWPPIILHVGLNTLWMLSDLGDNAIGGWLGNGLRLAVLAFALWMTASSLGWLRRLAGETAIPRELVPTE